jgi:solute carrier family 10 (sodium/bile acid cotransporter), member 7
MIFRQIERIARDPFLLGIVATIALATVAPDLGRSGGPLRADHLAYVGVVAVFFLNGVGLSTERLLHGLSRWRLHVVVQAFTFVVFPLLWLAFRGVAGGVVPADLMMGFFYLSALPSTISSSVAMTAIARGNVVAAMFNATLSSLLGVVVTPLLVSAAMGAVGVPIPVGDAMRKIAALLALPLAVGHVFRPVLANWIARRLPWIARVDRASVLLIVYVSFCDSVRAGLWTRHGPATLATTVAGAGLFLAAAVFLTRRAASWLRFDAEDEIPAVFCGSNKGLAAGVAMAKLLFAAHPAIGVMLLPIIVYHPLQLVVCSGLAERYARRP